MNRFPTYFVSHGGGPWPWMKESFGDTFNKLETSLQEITRSLYAKPKAIVVVSGHWEEDHFTLSSSAKPTMIYDYSGFPEHTYQIQYPAPGEPELAARIQQMLQQGGVEARLDQNRGFDHGTFTVMAPMFPEADIPIVQLSIRRDMDPQTHINVGRLLTPLRDEGILIIGSGLSYHNLRQFNATATKPSQEFDQWLQNALTAVTPQDREQLLVNWTEAPSARIAHPQEDHFLPLMVVVGAA